MQSMRSADQWEDEPQEGETLARSTLTLRRMAGSRTSVISKPAQAPAPLVQA